MKTGIHTVAISGFYKALRVPRSAILVSKESEIRIKKIVEYVTQLSVKLDASVTASIS